MPETDLNQSTNQQMSRTVSGAAGGFTAEERALRRKRANTLCVISLILFAGIPVVMVFLTNAVNESGLLSSENISTLSKVTLIIVCISMIVSWVLLIFTRVKYKESRFARILVWVCGGITVGIVAVMVCIFLLAFSLGAHL